MTGQAARSKPASDMVAEGSETAGGVDSEIQSFGESGIGSMGTLRRAAFK